MVWEPKEEPITFSTGVSPGDADSTAATDEFEEKAKVKVLHYWVISAKLQTTVEQFKPVPERDVAVEYCQNLQQMNPTIAFIMEKWGAWCLCASGEITDIDEAQIPYMLEAPNVKALESEGKDAPIKILGQGLAKIQVLCALLGNCVTTDVVANRAVKNLEGYGP